MYKYKNTSIIPISIKFPVSPEIRLAQALCEACKANNLEEARQLVELGADPNLQNYFISDDEIFAKYAALHWAVGHNNYELITLLLNAGADVNLESHGGYKPLHLVFWAQFHTEPPWLRKIIQATEHINRPNQQGYTVLHYATRYAAPQFVQMLLDHGASVNESSHKYYFHMLDAAIKSKNPITFRLIWNFSDKQLFKSLGTPESYINAMLEHGWYKPDKVACLYDVIDVVDKFTNKSIFLYYIALAEFGYEAILNETELMSTRWPSFEYGDPQFLNTNLCETIRRLHAHGADFSKNINKIAIIYLCYKYNICKNIERQYELLNTITELGVDITELGLFAGVNYPKLAIMLLKYSSKLNPIDLFVNATRVKRCDRAFLNYITTLLMLCSPEKEFRTKCDLSLNKMFDNIAIHRLVHTYTEDDFYKPYFLCLNKSEFDDLLVREERRELLQKVGTLLRIERVPTLQELARNKIRLSLKDKTPKEFLKAIDTFEVSDIIADIIQCQAPGCSFQKEDLSDITAPEFPFSELRCHCDTSISSLPQPQQNCQRQSNEDEEQILSDIYRLFSDVDLS